MLSEDLQEAEKRAFEERLNGNGQQTKDEIELHLTDVEKWDIVNIPIVDLADQPVDSILDQQMDKESWKQKVRDPLIFRVHEIDKTNRTELRSKTVRSPTNYRLAPPTFSLNFLKSKPRSLVNDSSDSDTPEPYSFEFSYGDRQVKQPISSTHTSSI